jgi:hypothetical protein
LIHSIGGLDVKVFINVFVQLREKDMLIVGKVVLEEGVSCSLNKVSTASS